MNSLIPIVVFSFAAINSFAQAEILAKTKFAKVSISEKITEQMITQSKKSIWVFTTHNIYYTLGETDGGLAMQYSVLKFKYDKTNYYVFYCKDEESQIEYAVQYKDIEPRHVLVQKMDGSSSFICHN